MVTKFQKGLSGTIQDVPQIEALRTLLHVELSELFEGKVTLKESCVRHVGVPKYFTVTQTLFWTALICVNCWVECFANPATETDCGRESHET